MSPAAAAAGAGQRRRSIASVRDGRGRGCGGPAGAALLGLSLVGLLLYLVPAAAALAWLAVGTTAAWWGLSREPRGSRPLSSFLRKARHRQTLFASPPAKSTANGNLLEPRTLLEGPDPAELLLMGSYLGKPGPPQPAPAPEGQDLRDRPGHRSPARPAPRFPPTHRVHHVYPSLPTPPLRPSGRPSPRDCGTLPNRFVITPRRRYPIHQAQYSCLGVLPTVCWNGYHKKAVLSPRNSRMVCSPVTVRIAPPDRRFSRSGIPEQIISSTLSSPSSNAPDPCAKETVLSALKEKKKKRTVEEDQIFLDGQENKRRRHDSSGSGHSAFEPLVANGVPASFVPKPGSLKRGLNSQSSDDHLNKRSRSSSMSSLTGAYTSGIPSSSRNAITSSYSSTRGISQPPPPQLGYLITAEDVDLEKKASLQWFNQALEDKSDAASNSVTETPLTTQPSSTFTLPAAAAASSPTSLPAPSTNPLLESLKKMQSPPSLPPCPESAGAATTEAPSPPKTPSLLPPLGLSQSGPPGPLPSPSLDSKPPTTLLGLIPAPSTVPATDTKSPSTLQTETATKPQATSAPSPAPKQSFLFGTQSTSPSSPAAPAASSASPMFKPIFTAPPKSEKEGPTPPGPSVTATAPSSSSLPTTTSTTAPTFQPVFSSMGPPASVPLPAPFKQTTAPATAPTTTAPLFTGLATATSAVAPVTSASLSADSASKPAFGFGINSGSSSSVSTTISTARAASQPFLFGAPQASAASFTPAMGSIFQFGKPPALPTTTTVTTFSQSLPTAVPTASSSAAGFSGFGSTLTTSSPATSSQPALTFSNTSTPTFNIPFGSSAKSLLPSYLGANPQPTFGAAEGQPLGAAKPALAPSFGSSFTFGNSAAPAAAPTPAPASTIKIVPAHVPTPIHPTFGGATHSAFGLKATASAFGTPTSSQPAFGGSTAVFSFGAATSSGFGATTQTASSGSSSSVFGSTTPSPFAFGGSAAPAGSGSFGINVATPGSSTTSGAFSFGAGQSGSTATSTPFAGGLGQNALGTTGQSTPFAFNVGSTPESKPVFGGTATPTFGQNTPAPGAGTSGSSLSFGASSAPAQGFVGVGPFGSAAPSFSIGAGSKTPGARQRLQARRQHTRKK
ncbi:nuclear envelope pore membrane protein POM 121C isoform X4 [Symphalangus syndactylus]|uniref:nuclear envelope pore membrane protein POM 121C isoform X4 n=1 Tax=Symphalangus syndactylus TaxID=9590 RepID=UPI0024433DFA|nr:nuclear envelope pore membrane protein POM 121C isoform X4 [Symphalangus syndactylus]